MKIQKNTIIEVCLIVSARPNFVKIAPLVEELKKRADKFNLTLIHTGQHYDDNMSKVFFSDLGIPSPDAYLRVSSGTQAEQVARTMIKIEHFFLRKMPNLIIVVGDVNSTLACSIVAAKLCIPLVHIEAGLRSFDCTMPEEINRIVTDSLSNFLFTTSEDVSINLRREGIAKDKIYFVGNLMIDTLIKLKKEIKDKAKIKINKGSYALLTLHRPSNVDNKAVFIGIIKSLQELKLPIIFPAHPRTQKRIKEFGCEKLFNYLDFNSFKRQTLSNSINITAPLSYLDFLRLVSNAKFVLTDSGGVQEETTFLGVPCLTLRENTERPITVREGTNILVGTERAKIISESKKIMKGNIKYGKIPKLWDGKAARRIVKILVEKF